MPTGRPPYVQFKESFVEDRAATDKEGRYIAKPVDHVVVRQVGSKDSVEVEATQWLAQIRKDPGFHPDWVKQYQAQYEAYKSGQEVTPLGTHVKTWPLISKAQSEMLLNANLRTVEDLAEASESALMNVGIGARDLQQKARAWLDTSRDRGVNAQELISLRTRVASQDDTIAQLRKTVEELAAKIIQQAKASSESDDFLGGQAA